MAPIQKAVPNSWGVGKIFPAQEKYMLCRCGHSNNKPFCDGTHKKIAFDGTETASRESFLAQANVTDGPMMQPRDAERLCAFARFSDPHGQVWNQVAQTDDDGIRAMFIRQVGNCPSGRRSPWTTGPATLWNLNCRFQFALSRTRNNNAADRSGYAVELSRLGQMALSS